MSPGPAHSYEPAELVPAGATLAEWLDQREMTRAELARRTDLTPKHISQIVTGGAGISPEVALALETVTEIPARYWNQLEANFLTAKQRAVETRRLEHHLDLVDQFPIKELERRGCIEHVGSKVETLRELLRFFGVANPSALKDVWLQPALYRQSTAFEVDEGALVSWLRISELRSGKQVTRPFDGAACRDQIAALRSLTTLPGIDWLQPLQETCASFGVALVVVKELAGCRINGATRWLSPDKAMIALSLRHRRNDIFWFTFFHELCHVLRHSKKQTFVDSNWSDINAELEAEADAFASRTLIPDNMAVQLPGLSRPGDVERFARSIGIAPGIVVGRMQHDGLIPHKQWTQFILRYQFSNE